MKLRITFTITGPVGPEDADVVALLTSLPPEDALQSVADSVQADPEVVIERTVEVVE